MDLNYLSLAGVSQVDFSFPAPYHFTLKQGFPLTNFLPTIFSGRLCCINNQNTLITLMITYSQFRGSLQIRVVQFTYDFINQIRMKKENFIHPPDLSKSEAHRKATRIFKGLEHDETGEQCQCCGRRIGMQKITGKCCYSDLQLAFLGSGLPLFFNFIKSSIMILVALCLVFCVFALTTNVLGNYCQKQGLCAPNIFNTLSLVNKINDISYLSVQNYVLLVFVLLFSLLMQLIRYRARKIISVCDSLINSPSDYAAMISRLPHGVTEADIKSMIQERRDFLTEEQKQSTKNLEVVKIILGFKMGKYIDAIQSNKKSFKASILQNHDFYPEQLPELNETSAIAVILFATQEGKDLFLYEASCLQKMCQSICDPCTPLSDHTIFGQRIAVERAPEPDDIIWENSNLSIKGAIGRKIGYNLLSFAILAVGGAAQYGLAVLETTLTNEKLIQYVGMASSILVALMNEVIYKFLIYTAQKERKLTQTKINTNLIIKMGFFLFLNAGVFMVAARILAQIKTFELSGTLSMQITQIMILNTITPHLSLIATDYLQIPAVLKRWAVRKNYLFATQMSANILYEKPTPEVSFKYGYLIRTLWLTALYCPLTPIVVPISVVGLLLNLAVQKCLHYKSYRTPNMVSSRQNATALEMVEFVPLIMSCGQFLIYLYFYRFRIELIPNYWAIPIYVSLGLSGLQILLPLQLVNKRLFKIDSQNNRLSYLEIENTFEATYEMVNPGYKSSVKRNRDKLLLKSLYKQIEELVELKPKEPLKQFLIGLGTKEDEIESNPLHILFKNQHFMTAFNTNQVY